MKFTTKMKTSVETTREEQYAFEQVLTKEAEAAGFGVEKYDEWGWFICHDLAPKTLTSLWHAPGYTVVAACWRFEDDDARTQPQCPHFKRTKGWEQRIARWIVAEAKRFDAPRPEEVNEAALTIVSLLARLNTVWKNGSKATREDAQKAAVMVWEASANVVRQMTGGAS